MGQKRQRGNERPKLKIITIIIIMDDGLLSRLSPFAAAADKRRCPSFRERPFGTRGGDSKGTGRARNELKPRRGFFFFSFFLMLSRAAVIKLLALMVTDRKLENMISMRNLKEVARRNHIVFLFIFHCCTKTLTPATRDECMQACRIRFPP